MWWLTDIDFIDVQCRHSASKPLLSRFGLSYFIVFYNKSILFKHMIFPSNICMQKKDEM